MRTASQEFHLVRALSHDDNTNSKRKFVCSQQIAETVRRLQPHQLNAASAITDVDVREYVCVVRAWMRA